MARHSEEECAWCEGDVLPLSYIVGTDDEVYCSVKCANLGEQQARTTATEVSAAGTEVAHA
jgi:hypothetical protein